MLDLRGVGWGEAEAGGGWALERRGVRTDRTAYRTDRTARLEGAEELGEVPEDARLDVLHRLGEAGVRDKLALRFPRTRSGQGGVRWGWGGGGSSRGVRGGVRGEEAAARLAALLAEAVDVLGAGAEEEEVVVAHLADTRTGRGVRGEGGRTDGRVRRRGGGAGE